MGGRTVVCDRSLVGSGTEVTGVTKALTMVSKCSSLLLRGYVQRSVKLYI